MSNGTVKEAALELIRSLPDDCTWDDVAYRIYVRRKIEEGHRDIEEGRVISHEEILAEFANASSLLDTRGTKTPS